MKVLIKVHTVVEIRWRKSSSKSTGLTSLSLSLSSLFLLNPTFSPSVHQGHTSKSAHLCSTIVQAEPRGGVWKLLVLATCVKCFICIQGKQRKIFLRVEINVLQKKKKKNRVIPSLKTIRKGLRIPREHYLPSQMIINTIPTTCCLQVGEKKHF